MKGKAWIAGLGAVLVLIAAGPTLADYDSIQHNLIDGSGDTTYTASTGLLVINATNNNLTLNDGGSPLGGTVTNATVSLQTTYVAGSYDPYAKSASFAGGSYLLTFDHNGLPYQIGGPIAGMVLTIDAGPSLSKIAGQGLWQAINPDPPSLPGSGVWPDGNDPLGNPNQMSSIQSLTLAFNSDLSWFEWNQNMGGPLNPAETLYNLFPDNRAVPEPVSLLLLGLGGLLLRRRSA